METLSSSRLRFKSTFYLLGFFFIFALLFTHLSDLQAKSVSSAEAVQVVRGWLKMDAKPLNTSLGDEIDDVETFTNEQQDALYYVVYLKPEGFVIVPADDMIEPVIAFIDKGIYTPSDKHPLGALVSRDIPARLAAVQELQQAASRGREPAFEAGKAQALEQISQRAEAKWSELKLSESAGDIEPMGSSSISEVWVAPLTESTWGQGNVEGYSNTDACYNYYTPPGPDNSSSNYPCGCVATSMAQTMRYHQYAAGGYVWADMPLQPAIDVITLTERQTIGDFCFDVAESVDTSYGSGGSSAYIWKARNALPNTFGYGNAIDGWDNNNDLSGPSLNGMVNPNLDAAYPVLLGIYNSGSGGGHAVVCDGYGYNFSTLYHHINMGWDGRQNAWYNLPDIDSSPSYNTVDECIYNIYTSGSGEIISGRVTDTCDNPISGAYVTADRSGGGTYNASTDSHGIYALAKVPSASTYTVSVTKSGYSFTDQVAVTGTSVHDTGTSGNTWGVNFVGTLLGDFQMDCDVDFYDFVILGEAWMTSLGDPSYNSDCDISNPADDAINFDDLDVFTQNWLAGTGS